MGGENYLVPVDALGSPAIAMWDETVSLERQLEAIDGARRLKLVILDASRNNPFLAGMAVTNKTRAIDRGLARIEPASADLLVAFAAKAGSVAEDGDLDTSPFAAALARLPPRRARCRRAVYASRSSGRRPGGDRSQAGAFRLRYHWRHGHAPVQGGGCRASRRLRPRNRPSGTEPTARSRPRGSSRPRTTALSIGSG